MAINNTLKDIREERNLIQADLAEAIGSCSQTIGRIERGERNPSLEIASDRTVQERLLFSAFSPHWC